MIAPIELERTTFGYVSRFDGHNKLEIVVFKKPGLKENWQWKSHFITDKCIACTICERVCPTNAISGGERFYIDPDLCINCSVCGVYCPFDAINDSRETLVTRGGIGSETVTSRRYCASGPGPAEARPSGSAHR